MSDPGSSSNTIAFGRYADWYDAFNPGKHYDSEASYVFSNVVHLAGPPSTWLDIGCGTGHHVASLKRMGVAAEGVDASVSMIERARRLYPDVTFHVAAAQEFSVQPPRDVVSMLFHVIDYQTDDDALDRALERVSAHLAPGSLFAFDFWNSDAVLRDPPHKRVRTATIDGRSLFRLSYPSEDRSRRLIDVRYEFRWDSEDGPMAHQETHALRHFGLDELATRLDRFGLDVASSHAWLTTRPVKQNDWYGFACARRRGSRG